MARPAPVPPTLVGRPFTRKQAIADVVSSRQLQGPRFLRLYPSVYMLGACPTPEQRLAAAALYLPPGCLLSHHTRLLPLGLEMGALEPLHFTTSRATRIAAPGIVLHRSRLLPPHRDGLVDVEAAVVGAATTLSFVDLVATMDWLVHRGHLDLRRLESLLEYEHWRPGSRRTRDALAHVEPRSRSIPESRTRMLLILSGLPRPESNVDVYDANGRWLFCADLVYRWLKLAIEYEGRQHELDPAQFRWDIERYAGARAAGWDYVQVTAVKLARARACVLQIHGAMRRRGYDGPSPNFGAAWAAGLRMP